MGDQNEENIDDNWVIVNFTDVAEETLENRMIAEQINGEYETSTDSDSVSIISEGNHLQDNIIDEDVLTDEDIAEAPSTVEQKIENDEKDNNVNWMFVAVDTNTSSLESSKKFYLNCLQEPVQELSENEHSDLETDHFCINESLNEEGENKICEGISNNMIETEYLGQERTSNVFKKHLNGLLVGTVLLAISSIFLGHYLNSVESLEEELPNYQDEFSGDIQESLSEIHGKYDVPTALTYCTKKHKSDGIFKEVNIKKCMNKIDKQMNRKRDIMLEKEKLRSLEEYLNVKEKYLDQKEKILIKREFDILKSEMKLKYDQLLKNIDEIQPATTEKEMDPEIEINTEKESGNIHGKKSSEGKNEFISNFKRKEFTKFKVKFEQEDKKLNRIKNYTSSTNKENKNNRKKFKPKIGMKKIDDNSGNSENRTRKLKRRFENYDSNNGKGAQNDYEKSKNEDHNYKHYEKKHKRSFADTSKAKWYFDWMRGREILRLVDMYYS